jgi:3-methyladenine DNA glycosylase AlkD
VGVLDISRQLTGARKRLRQFGDRERAAFSLRFFKTGPGEYAEGDRFLGLRVPDLRKVAGEFRSLSLSDLRELLASKWHEERLLALVILTRQYARASDSERDAIYRLYLASTARINNWDLVDVSAAQIVGAHLIDRSRAPLRRLAKSRSVWERRIAVIATQQFIRAGEFEDTLAIVKSLLSDPHDLIHKAAGWMLREVGKRDRPALERFLKRNAARMPRTMLRYAIERFPPALRKKYLAA